MGFSVVTKRYVLYDLQNKTFFISRDVIFRERIFPLNHSSLATPAKVSHYDFSFDLDHELVDSTSSAPTPTLALDNVSDRATCSEHRS